jgi:DNA-directed RNA polymerase specialized sigma24 family protein
MTTVNSREALQRYVAAPSTRNALTAYVRRRGLYGDADDVVQTVICDALAVQAVPVEPSDLPRWITGIARRKVADEHRRRARLDSRELPELATSDRHEVTDLLRRIQRDLIDADQRRSLEWVVREHSGDALNEIATEQALQPATVRQRVSRLRRHLRARYVGALALLLAIAGGAAALSTVAPKRPAGNDTAHTQTLSLLGTWRVADSSRSDVLPLGLVAQIEPNRVRVQDSTGRIETALSYEASADGSVVVRSGGTIWHARVHRLDAERIEIRNAHGYVTLARMR